MAGNLVLAQNAGNTSVQGVAVEITVRMATLAVVLTLFTASATCSTCSSENNTLPPFRLLCQHLP